jgi:micrococcal nuclease
VRDRAGKLFTVRIIGIDTPETKDPRKPVMCGGAEATKFATKFLNGKVVALIFDPTQDKTDKYGRLLAYVKVANKDYGFEAINQGYAAEYTFKKAYIRQADYRAAQAKAKQDPKSVWKVCGGIKTPLEPKQKQEPKPEQKKEKAPKKVVYYDNCTEVREAGAAPIRRGDDGYSSDLDRDGDGVACE